MDARLRDELTDEIETEIRRVLTFALLDEARSSQLTGSPREVARRAASSLALSLEDRNQCSRRRLLSEQLAIVVDRHSLARKKHFYAFVDEVDYQFTRQVHSAAIEADALKYHAHDLVAPAVSAKPSFLSKLAAFMGLPLGAAEREYRSLTTRELESIWELVIEDFESSEFQVEHSLWHLLHERILRVLSDTLTARPVLRRVPKSRHLVRDRLLAFGFWTGTPPPADVAASPSIARLLARHPKLAGGYSETACRLRSRGGL